MYHDQALIPIKTVGFHEGVNATLGLPFIRTSPDHGTALALAGTGRANPTEPDRRPSPRRPDGGSRAMTDARATRCRRCAT